MSSLLPNDRFSNDADENIDDSNINININDDINDDININDDNDEDFIDDNNLNDGEDGFVDEEERETVSLLYDDTDRRSRPRRRRRRKKRKKMSAFQKSRFSRSLILAILFTCVLTMVFVSTIPVLLGWPSEKQPVVEASRENNNRGDTTATQKNKNTDKSTDKNSDKNTDNKENTPLPPSPPPPRPTPPSQSITTASASASATATAKQPTKSEEDSENRVETTLFQLNTGNERIDRAYRLAMDELQQNIKTDDPKESSPYFVAGAGWDQLWTRDTSYAIELGAGLVRPQVAMRSLQTCTEVVVMNDGRQNIAATVWYQDVCGHFGGWPNLSDAIVGARGAWHMYLYTGNTTFLEWAYETTVSSLLRAEYEVLGAGVGNTATDNLFGGCSSFMESNSGYPKKYRNNGDLVGKTKALSTNILYYNGYYYAYKMGTILMENNIVVNKLKDRAKELKKSIRNRLWMETKGLYAYFEDEEGNLIEQTEGLGIALALLSEDFESEHRVRMMLKNTYRTGVGIPSLWPRFDLGNNEEIAEYYHNGRIWPFVSGYFAIAAARHGRPEIFAEEMANLIKLSEQKDTFAEFYELDKSFPEERRRQLWSDTGYLGMVYKGLFGMDFQTGGIEFSPTKVDGENAVLKTDETISLLNVKYRKAVLDIHVTGHGTNITSFKLNGFVRNVPRVHAHSTGRQLIEIEVAP